VTEAEAPKPATPSATDAAPEKASKAKRASETSGRGGRGLAMFACLLALGAAGAAGYPYYLQLQGQSEAQAVATTLSEALRILRQENSAQAQALAEQRTAVAGPSRGPRGGARRCPAKPRSPGGRVGRSGAKAGNGARATSVPCAWLKVRYLTAIATQPPPP
jgi:hypothetical protein